MTGIATAGVFAAAALWLGLRERAARRLLRREREKIEKERAEMRARLQHMDRLATLGTLAASVAHELKSPLTTILGFAQLSLASALSEQEIKDAAVLIESNVDRCRRIIQDLLIFSRQKTERNPADVNELIKKCVQLQKYDWMADRLKIVEEYDVQIPRISLAGSEFQQVVFNLLNNAHHAIRSAGVSPGCVRVTTRLEGEGVRVVIADNGPGIPPDVMEKIWEPFFTTKKEGEGTGLGLAIARQIVSEQGGELSVASKPGEGAAFTITLPLRPSQN